LFAQFHSSFQTVPALSTVGNKCVGVLNFVMKNIRPPALGIGMKTCSVPVE
jgi:hypothetical protein